MMMMNASPHYSLAAFPFVLPIAVFWSLGAKIYLILTHNTNSLENKLLPQPSSSNLTHNQLLKNEERIAIVTGSNTGIGMETARSLVVNYGYTVILACRSRDKAERAMKEINNQLVSAAASVSTISPPGQAIFVHPLDLSSFDSVRSFCQHIQSKFKTIHLLVNNAGRNSSGKSEDNLDLLFQTNFLGHFLLTSLLLDSMAPNARVINLSSVMHHFCHGIDLTDASQWKGIAMAETTTTNVYSLSKLAALLFTGMLNQRYGDRIISIAVNPGAVNSDIWRNFPRWLDPIHEFFYLTNRQGCCTSVAACVLPTLSLSNNAYPYLQPYWQFGTGRVLFPSFEMLGPYQGYRLTPPRLPYNTTAAAEAMWQVSVELTKAQWPTTM